MTSKEENVLNMEPNTEESMSEKEDFALEEDSHDRTADLDQNISDENRTFDDTDALPKPEEERILALKQEIQALKLALQEAESLNQRISEELGEFHLLFPETEIQALPESVWEQVKNGIPLSAAYALYEKKRVAAEMRATRVNLQNAAMSSGSAGKNTSSEYFSPDEVRSMSQEEVRRHYTKILESMKKWLT